MVSNFSIVNVKEDSSYPTTSFALILQDCSGINQIEGVKRVILYLLCKSFAHFGALYM